MYRPASIAETAAQPRARVLEAHLLGTVDFASALALQQRLAFEAGGITEPRISLLLCEHPPLVTVGRQGSRGDVLFSREELASHRLEVQWVARGGGSVLHGPGQLAVYPIVPLENCGWNVGEFLARFQAGLTNVLESFRFALQPSGGRLGIWGRSGQLVTIGAAVRNWVSLHGAFIHVAPPMDLVRKVLSDPLRRQPASSLSMERQQVVKMTDLRTRLIPELARTFDCDRFQIFTGHPLLRAESAPPVRGVRYVG